MVVGAVPDSRRPTSRPGCSSGRSAGATAGGAGLVRLGDPKGYQPPAPRPDLANPDHFYRVRGVSPRSTWARGGAPPTTPTRRGTCGGCPRSGEIIGLRYSELPPPVSPLLGAGGVPLTPLSPGGLQRASGMRVLGTSGDRPPKLLCDELRPRPDGLDHLTGGTWGRVPEPVDPEEDRGPDRG